LDSTLDMGYGTWSASLGETPDYRHLDQLPVHLRGVPFVHFESVLRGAIDAAENGRGFGLVRLGDREVAVVEHPCRDISINAPSENFPAGWNLGSDTVAAMKGAYAEVLDGMDAVGVVWHMDSVTARLIKAIGSLPGRPTPRAWCKTLAFRRPHRYGSLLRTLLSGRHVVCVGREATAWSAVLRVTCDCDAIAWAMDSNAALNDFARYQQVEDWVREEAEPNGSVVLAGLGPWAVVLCGRLRLAGKLALDLGAGLRIIPKLDPTWTL